MKNTSQYIRGVKRIFACVLLTTMVSILPAKWASAQPLSALNFDGQNDYVAINNPFTAFGKEITVEWWVNPSNTPQGSGIGQATSNSDNNANSNVWLMHFWNANTLTFFVNDNGTWRGTPEVVIPLNTWTHLVGVADATSTRLYMNGTLVATGGGISNNIFNNSNSVIHFGKDVRFNLGRFLTGSMDEVRIWNRALCIDEIQNNRTCQLSPNQNGLLGYYKFNEGIAGGNNTGVTSLTDHSGNGRHGSFVNMALNGSGSNYIAQPAGLSGATCSPYVPPTIAAGNNGPDASGSSIQLTATSGFSSYRWSGPNGYSSTVQNPVLNNVTPAASGTYTVIGTNATGCSNTASVTINTTAASSLGFDGVNDYVATPSGTNLSNQSFTFECWAKANAVSRNNIVAGQGAPSTNVGLHIGFRPNNTFTFAFFNNDLNTTATYTDLDWHHWACVYEVTSAGNTRSIYRDGILVAQDFPTSNYVGSGDFNIGRHWSGANFQGHIDEVRLWDRALCQGEIQNNMNCELGGSQTGLLRYYKFNQGFAADVNTAITTAVDASGNNANGTLTNFALNGTSSNWVAPGGVVSNASCNMFVAPVAIITPPSTTILCAGSAIEMNVNTGNGRTYQWRLNDNNIQGATSSNYIASAAGTYTVAVTENLCTSISNPIAITADQTPPVAVCKDANLTLNANGTASIIIPATTQTLLFEDWTGDNASYYSSTSPVHPNNTLNWNVIGDIDRANFVAQIPGFEIDLAGFNNGAIESKQTFNFTPGTYTFSFQQVANSLGGNGVQVEIGSLFNQSFITSLSVTSESATFTVTGNTSAKVKLTQIGPDDARGSFIGQIRLVRNLAATLAIENGSSDNCGIASITASKTEFDCSNIGNNVVTLTVTDLNGNQSTCQANVFIRDTIFPVITSCPANINLVATSALGATANYTLPTAFDICGATITRTAGLASGSVFPLGTTTVTHEAADASGNSVSCSFTVTVSGLAPAIVGPGNIAVNTDPGACSAIVQFAATETTGVPASTITYSIAPGSTFQVGTTAVTATATNAIGSSSVTFNVVVNDNQLPNVLTQNISIDLDASGNASITAAQIDNGSNDACGIASTSVSPSTFDCSSVGPNTVTLTVTDANGNMQTATAVVTVNDVTAPVALTQNLSIDLDASGNASITAAQIDNGSSDACGIASISISPSTFDCSSVGANTVTLTVTDVNGNTQTETAVVTVNDVTAPVVLTQNLSIDLDASGNVSITAAQIDNGSNDACGIASISVSPSTFDCSNVGANTVTLTVTDVNGNAQTETAVVTVSDVTAPVVLTQNVTVTLAGGSASITAAQIDNGSNDACGIASISVSPNSFDCSNIGDNTVTLTAVDLNGNTATQTAIVHVVGSVPVCTITSAPNNSGTVIGSTTTFAAANQMFLGYGAQSMNLNCSASGDGPFTYAWTGAGLSSNSIANPIFTPTAGGNYTFSCTVTNRFGCETTCDITICVIDVRDPKSNARNPKVLICHIPPGNPNNPRSLSVGVSAVPAHVGRHGGDRLGTCNSDCNLLNGGMIGRMAQDVYETIEDGDIHLTVYPNPSNGAFNFVLEHADELEKVSVMLYDMNGKLVYQLTDQQSTDPIVIQEELAAGVYNAHVRCGNFLKVVKVTRTN